MRTRFMFYLHFILYKEGLGQFDIKDNNRNFTIPLRDIRPTFNTGGLALERK